MESPNKTHFLFRLSRRILGSFGAFSRNDRGTALTEFVIMLPVFILIWVGMINLFKLENGGMRAKIKASSQTWEKAMTVAHGGHVPEAKAGVHIMAGLDAIDNVNNRPSGTADSFAHLKNARLASQGNRGEAQGSATMARLLGQTPPAQPAGQGLRSHYSRAMLDDSRSNFINSAPGPLGIYAPVIPESIQSIGYNHAPATGNRYGSVFGEHIEQVEVYGQMNELGATYDVLNSPVGKPKRTDDLIYVPGFSRLMAEQDKCLRSVLELGRRMKYFKNCL
ncbi:TadE/TadG family type IV pilus assembly protein [Bradymonas sediminis]|uniref:Uncharacterized protein n=1 Tax=Bradymonas sediminis TaxID=1548548 RepID=A0A2Z4FQ90_9DELT|nr:hypothetical protein [Bradymonas sediminis]AWV91241.1 hypothetical protein DN745_18675 [Bradymonas sediminis]TDP73808.1 hypothetical protein DFR33_105140 [Bradymonas sediminis]